ncbi:hypothetical protein BH24BAC1_BH24BAC1_00770 [soil metagenome]
MKVKSLVLLWLLLGLLSFSHAQENYANLTVSPAQPQPGKQVKFTYNPKGTDLAGKKVEAIAYLYAHGKPNVIDVALTQAKGVWKGTLPTTPETTSFHLFFISEEIYDNNQGKGYAFLLYDTKKNPVKGAHGDLANTLTSAAGLMKMERDLATAALHFEKEFARFPDNKLPFIFSYANVLADVKKAAAKELVVKELDALVQQPDLPVDQLPRLAFLYQRFQEEEKGNNLTERARQLNPKGMVEQDRMGAWYQEKDLTRRMALLEELARDFPESEQLPYAYGAIANELAKQEQYGQFEQFAAKSPKAASWAVYNSAAWSMALADKDLPLAQKFAAKGYELAQQEAETPKGEKPDWFSEKQWREHRLQNVGMVGDTYGYILLKQGKPAEALPLLEEATRLQRHQNVEINERYVEALVKNGQQAQAKAAMERYISSGHSNAKIKEYLRDGYVKEKGSEAGFAAYAQKVEAPALDKMRAEVKKKLISEPAPAFALEDLNGKKVSLADLKGKTVIVDFWATWCGPCISSFPSMQEAVNKFKNDDKVAFVFINSWENGEDKKKVAGDFLAKRNFAFDVLMDTENKTIGDFKVEGIPTKFIIDKNGNIRYKSVGFGGNGEAAVTEISMIVELLR